MLSRRPTLTGPLHVLMHVVIVLIGWFIFGWFWLKVLFEQTASPADLSWLVIGTLVVIPAITLGWVLHNRSLYARKGPRTHGRYVADTYTRDWMGRLVLASFDQLRRMPFVIIDATDTEKSFRSTNESLYIKQP